MKVILMQEVKGKGGEGDVVDVARGYAVNFLLPRKMALEATPGNLKQLEARMDNIRKRDAARFDDASAIKAMLDEKSVTIEAKVGDGGRLFGSVTGPMIEEAILEQLGVEVDRRKMDVHAHIKEIGVHTVTVQIYRDVKAEVSVKVIGEGGVVEPEPVVETAPAVAETDVVAEAEDVAEAEETEAADETSDATDEVAE